MKITLSENGEIILSSAEAAKFARHRTKQSNIILSPIRSVREDLCDVPSLSFRTVCEGETFILTAEHDGIYRDKNGFAVEKIRKVKKAGFADPVSDPFFTADAFLTAHILCKMKRLLSVTLIVTVSGEDCQKSFETHLNADYLERAADALLSRCAPFAKEEKAFLTKGIKSIKSMPFPFTSIRSGQEDFIKEAYKAIKRHRRLLVEAPTGIGKTASALFPAVKAIADGQADKVFYLTSKTVTGIAASNAAERMARHAPELRCITVSAKERVCPANDKNDPFTVDECSYSCPRLGDTDEGTYDTRRLAAILELLEKNVLTEADIKRAASKYCLCPYELSLDTSEYCHIIICDYNYVFDDRVKFRRYFVSDNIKHILLIDEAHNLPDRAREMLSATAENTHFSALAEKVEELFPLERSLLSALGKISEYFDGIKKYCLEDAEYSNAGIYGYYIADKVPSETSKVFKGFPKIAKDFKGRCDDGDTEKLLKRAMEESSDLVRSAEEFDGDYVFFAETKNDRVEVKIMCLDPSKKLDGVMKNAVSSVLFSATLAPFEYFTEVLGCKDAMTLSLESPYDSDNLCIAAMDKLSTKYLSRGDTASEIAEAILTVTEAKAGNYLVYFPSYSYMKGVVRHFLDIAPPDVKAVMQKPDMSIASRKKFLSFFENESEAETLVGFCVLGGVFSEGIDLPDKRLIGAVLVGIGIPGLSSETNIMKEYYDRKKEAGFDYAFLYPGMIKITQAAGRVIRSETDRGVVVLIDERYRDPNVKRLLPAHWKNIHYIGDSYSLGEYLRRFWEKKE